MFPALEDTYQATRDLVGTASRNLLSVWIEKSTVIRKTYNRFILDKA